MAVTIVRPTAIAVVDKGVGPGIEIAGSGNVLADQSDGSFVRLTSRPGDGSEHEPTYLRLSFQNSSVIPATDIVTSVTFKLRMRGVTSTNAGVCIGLLDYVTGNYSDNNYWYRRVSATTFADVAYGFGSMSYLTLNIPAGYTEVALAGGNDDTREQLEISEVWFELTHGPGTLPPPGQPNDRFADAALLAGESGSTSFALTGTTAEPGETFLDIYYWGDHESVWFKWTCPSNWAHDSVVFETHPPPDLPYGDTSMTVYTGTIQTGLTYKGWSDDYPTLNSDNDWSNGAQVYVKTTPGETYYVRVTGDPEETGTLTWGPGLTVPVNDNFADRLVLTKDGPEMPVVFGGSGVEWDEPEGAADWAYGSLWYQYTTGPEDTSFRINVKMSSSPYSQMDMYVYEGTEAEDDPVSALIWNGWVKSDYLTEGQTRLITISARSSRRYYIQLIPESAEIRINPGTMISVKSPPTPPPPPANNSVSTAEDIPSDGAGYNVHEIAGATSEPGEPNAAGGSGRTIWFKWTTPDSLAGTQQQLGAQVIDYDTRNYMGISIYTGGPDFEDMNVVWASAVSSSGGPTLTVQKGTTYWIQVSDYYGTNSVFKVKAIVPRTGVLRVNPEEESWAEICTCPDSSEPTGETVTATWGNPTVEGGQSWVAYDNTTNGLLSGYTLDGYTWTGPAGVGGSGTWWLPEGAATAQPPKYPVMQTNAQTNPTVSSAYFTPNKELAEGALSSVTIRALVKSPNGVYISLAPYSTVVGVKNGIGGKFTSSDWQWVERTFDVTDRSLDERRAWAGTLKNVSRLLLSAWAPPNTGQHEVAKAYATLTSEKFASVATGRLKIYATSNWNVEPTWYTQKCCAHTMQGRRLKVKAGAYDWRNAGCFVREPTDWIQLPDETFEWNPAQQTFNNAGITPPRSYPYATIPPLGTSLFSGGYSFLGGFYGQKEMDQACCGHIDVDTDDVAAECCWEGARKISMSWQWWSPNGGYGESTPPGTNLCVLPTGMMGAAHNFTADWPIGYASIYEPHQFGIGFGDGFDMRSYTTGWSVPVYSMETNGYFARPYRHVTGQPPGATLEWEGGGAVNNIGGSLKDAPYRGQLIDLSLSPGSVGAGPTAHWYIHRALGYGERDALGWGFANFVDSRTALITGFAGGPEGAGAYLSQAHYLGSDSGGQNPWYPVPEDVINEGRRMEVNHGVDFGLMAHGVPHEILSSTPPNEIWPMNDATHWYFRSRNHIAIKFTVRPQRYRWVYNG